MRKTRAVTCAHTYIKFVSALSNDFFTNERHHEKSCFSTTRATNAQQRRCIVLSKLGRCSLSKKLRGIALFACARARKIEKKMGNKKEQSGILGSDVSRSLD
jgi:hypothetical protein